MTYRENGNNPDGSRRVDDHTRCVKRKLDDVVDSVPPDKGFEVLDGQNFKTSRSQGLGRGLRVKFELVHINVLC